MEVFDEDVAVDFIKKHLEKSGINADKYNADDILEVIDIIWDFYEDNGFLDLDMAEDSNENADREVLIAHVSKMLRKDPHTRIQLDDVPLIVDGELQYEEKCDEI